MGYSIKVTEHAHNDLDQIVSYIVGELGNPSAALTLLTAVERVYEKLAKRRTCMACAGNRCFPGKDTEKRPSKDT